MSVSYRDVGVDLDVADVVAARIKERIGAGLFGGIIPIPAVKAYAAPCLVTSIDGIGTKVRLAADLGRTDGLGKDIVHHCVNDIAVHGAEPLFFLDYLAFHTVDASLVESLIASMANACDALHMRFAGGETAEMPLVYPPNHFDVAGAVVGVVEEARIVDGTAIREGDLVVGIASSGLHTNGFSLVQALFGSEEYGRFSPALGATLGEALLEPHRCYLHDIRDLMATGCVHGLAHITGGGIAGNLARIIPAGLEASIELPPSPPLIQLLEERGVAREEMRRVFNMGIGLIAVCAPSIAERASAGYDVIGEIRRNTETDRRVSFRDRS